MDKKFTQDFQSLLQEAQSLANIGNNNEITSLHILKVLLKNNIDIKLFLTKLNINIENFEKDVNEELNKLPVVSDNSNISVSSELSKTISQMEKIAHKNNKLIDSDFFIPASFDANKKVAILLKIYNINSGMFEKITNEEDFKEKQKKENSILDKYTIDLTEKARNNKIDPVIGRTNEIHRAIQILSRRNKNNPVLIGEPGVGKTAIVEGLAQRIVNNEVPLSLKNKRLLTLDLTGLLAGAKYRGEFEERLKNVIKEVQEDNGNTILFIDEIHMLVGAGKTDGAMDAANILKPALSRGEIHCIGATTLDEYRENIEKDPALERRFQKVLVNEPTTEDAIAILRGLKEKYELHHKVKITDDAIISAVDMSKKYINDRFLPDKAIDLIDEACAQIKIELDSKPEKIDLLERKLTQLKIEFLAIEKDNSKDNQSKKEDFKNKIYDLEKEITRLTELWNKEKNNTNNAQAIREEIEDIKFKIQMATKSGKLEDASMLQYEQLPKLIKLLEIEEQKTNSSVENELFKTFVSQTEIAQIISRITGIPTQKLISTEKTKLLKLEDSLHKTIVGQHDAVKRVAKTIRRNRAGIGDQNKPIGSFLFLGPTGTGKTQLVKSLSELLFNTKDAIVRIDMSEYMEKHSISKLIGSPPGYIGYEEGGALTETIRRKPYSIILFDEIEKAHPDIFNLLLQVLDEGHLTDSHGKVVNFKNTIIVMTSNLGSNKIQENIDKSYDEIKNIVMTDVKLFFKPELINRLDEIVVFKQLSKEEIFNIVKIQLNNLKEKLLNQNITCDFEDNVVDYIVKIGYDPLYGARPLKRAIQNEIEDFITDLILDEKISSNPILIKIENNKLVCINGKT